jgi:hypothetical protein
MSVKPDGLTGEVLHAHEYQEGGKAFLFHCCECSRMVLNETVFVDDAGELHCMGCAETGELAE